jgi:hypothetical protein
MDPMCGGMADKRHLARTVCCFHPTPDEAAESQKLLEKMKAEQTARARQRPQSNQPDSYVTFKVTPPSPGGH